MHDPDTQIFRLGPFTLWHHDPCNRGSDDSCGWFPRAHHGDEAVLKKIVGDFAFDWDRVYKPSREDHDDEDGEFVDQTYFRGLFKPNGDPLLSVQGIVLNLFTVASNHAFKGNRKKSFAYLRSHLFDILLFAENPVDSLRDSIMRTFAKGCGSEYTDAERMARIESMASMIYGYILRDTRPWYRHPRWHIHHWRLSCRWVYQFKRWRNGEKDQTACATSTIS